MDQPLRFERQGVEERLSQNAALLQDRPEFLWPGAWERGLLHLLPDALSGAGNPA